MIRSTDGREVSVYAQDGEVVLHADRPWPGGRQEEARYVPEYAFFLGEWLIREGHAANRELHISPVMRQAVCLVNVHGACVRSLDRNNPMQVNALDAVYDAARSACQDALDQGCALPGLASAVGMVAMDFVECYGLEKT